MNALVSSRLAHRNPTGPTDLSTRGLMTQVDPAAVRSVCASARHSVAFVVAPTGIESTVATAATLAERGIDSRAVVDSRSTSDADLRGHIAALRDTGTVVRVVRAVQHGAVVVDRRAAVVDPGEPGRPGARLITDTSVVTVMHTLFASMWERADDVGHADVSDSAATTFDDADRTVLRMLASGYTDDRASQMLGYSCRTYRRRVADLMERLDSESRFQAGIAAHSRGWIG